MRQSHYNELMKIAADLEAEGDGDIAKSLRYAIANPSFNGAELQRDRDSWRALAESAKRDLAALAPTAEQAEGVRVGWPWLAELHADADNLFHRVQQGMLSPGDAARAVRNKIEAAQAAPASSAGEQA